jgi:hypothetical protein
MSYRLTLHCGCLVHVSCHPATRIVRTRVIEARGLRCTTRRHDPGVRVYLWELLPQRTHSSLPAWVDGETGREI